MANKVLQAWKVVFSNGRYLVLSGVVAVAFYGFNVLIGSYQSLLPFYSSSGLGATIKLFFALFVGFWQSVRLHSFISLIIVSVLLGVLLSLVVFKVVTFEMSSVGNKKKGLFSSFGVFLAALAPGCAACGLGLAPLLGLSTAFLLVLPFEGLELSIIAIAILSFSTWKMSKDLFECKIVKKNLRLKNDK